ncbi:MAG: hypothetical protein Q7S35_07385, partial [Candidatus Limnocylindrales bacterium]|nr:hypothetical protein [Candidatus Limnocylindrales bacterium]
LPLLAFIGVEEPLGVPFDHPSRVAYYRQTVLASVLGVVSGSAAILLGRGSTAPPFKLVVIGLGVAGTGVSSLLLLTLVGLCGPAVLWGSCNP